MSSSFPGSPSSSALFFLLRRCPPSSTLFPYTTLFRSSRPCNEGIRERISELWPLPPPPRTAAALRRGLPGQSQAWKQDRKSTRLNSSHTVNSYAVFCLKKKNSGSDHAVVPLLGALRVR